MIILENVIGDTNMKNEILLFENQDVKLKVNMKDETVWLSQQQMAKLFHTSRTNITNHIKYVKIKFKLEY